MNAAVFFWERSFEGSAVAFEAFEAVVVEDVCLEALVRAVGVDCRREQEVSVGSDTPERASQRRENPRKDVADYLDKNCIWHSCATAQRCDVGLITFDKVWAVNTKMSLALSWSVEARALNVRESRGSPRPSSLHYGL